LDPPHLKIGTLNSLILLSDELGKHDSMMEGVVRKIVKQYLDICHINSSALSASMVIPLSVSNNNSNMTPSTFVERFKWNDVKYPTSFPLVKLVSTMVRQVSSTEDELKKMNTSLAETAAIHSALNRKK
jgi:V-type H+-transporting ATPase subunit C